jgi:menaquinone-9 beta-reductase
VGADGANSQVRRWAGLESGPRPRLRYAFRRHFRIDPWTDHMEVYWGKQCQGYATAVSGGQVCVALASGDPQMRLEAGLATLPGLAERLRGAEIVSAERGALTGNRQFRRVCRGNVALLGDASGTVDAIAGEGLGLAFCQALRLAECLERGDLSGYPAEHRQLMRRPLGMARLMLVLNGRPHLQRRTLEVLEKHPEIFRRFVELHLGELAPLDIVKDGLSLGWGLLTA